MNRHISPIVLAFCLLAHVGIAAGGELPFIGTWSTDLRARPNDSAMLNAERQSLF